MLMKMFYVVYKENGISKKASVDEQRYKQLKENKEVCDLTIYTSEFLMEQAFSNLNSNGNNKKILFS